MDADERRFGGWREVLKFGMVWGVDGGILEGEEWGFLRVFTKNFVPMGGKIARLSKWVLGKCLFIARIVNCEDFMTQGWMEFLA